MSDFPRARILSPREPVRLSSRQRRERAIHIIPTRPLRRGWSEAVVKVLVVLGVLALVAAIYIAGVHAGILPGEFVKR